MIHCVGNFFWELYNLSLIYVLHFRMLSHLHLFHLKEVDWICQVICLCNLQNMFPSLSRGPYLLPSKPSLYSFSVASNILLYHTSKYLTPTCIYLWHTFRFSIFHLIACYSSLLDVDECIEGTHDCDNATEYCLNRKGSFNCECSDGYRKKASSCQGKQSMVYFW